MPIHQSFSFLFLFVDVQSRIFPLTSSTLRYNAVEEGIAHRKRLRGGRDKKWHIPLLEGEHLESFKEKGRGEGRKRKRLKCCEM